MREKTPFPATTGALPPPRGTLANLPGVRRHA